MSPFVGSLYIPLKLILQDKFGILNSLFQTLKLRTQPGGINVAIDCWTFTKTIKTGTVFTFMTKKGGKAVCFGDSCFLRFGSKVISPQTFEVQLSTPTLMPSDWTSTLSVGNGRISLVCSPFQELCSQFQFVETIKLQSHNRSLYENRSKYYPSSSIQLF